jgi:hypothetical protein
MQVDEKKLLNCAISSSLLLFRKNLGYNTFKRRHTAINKKLVKKEEFKGCLHWDRY